MFEKFVEDARSIVVSAVNEAHTRGDRRIGSDHLLLGLLHDKDSVALIGVSLDDARSADLSLDARALAAIGLDVGVPSTAWSSISSMKRTPFSTGAKDVLRDALREASAEKSRTINARHLILALIGRTTPDPAAALLDALQVDRSRVRSALAIAA